MNADLDKSKEEIENITKHFIAGICFTFIIYDSHPNLLVPAQCPSTAKELVFMIIKVETPSCFIFKSRMCIVTVVFVRVFFLTINFSFTTMTLFSVCLIYFILCLCISFSLTLLFNCKCSTFPVIFN